MGHFQNFNYFSSTHPLFVPLIISTKIICEGNHMFGMESCGARIIAYHPSASAHSLGTPYRIVPGLQSLVHGLCQAFWPLECHTFHPKMVLELSKLLLILP